MIEGFNWLSKFLVEFSKKILGLIPIVGSAAVILTDVVPRLMTAAVDKALQSLVTVAASDILPHYNSLIEFLALVNSFVPLSETFVLFGAWLVVWGYCATYRLAKSYLWGAS